MIHVPLIVHSPKLYPEPKETAAFYGLVAAMLASRDFRDIRRKRLPIFMAGADHAFQDPMGRWIATGTLAE
jgi:hypothetical protein